MFNSKIIQQQEEEFYKLNEEVNLNTKDLLNEIQQWKESQKNEDEFSEKLQIPKDVIALETEKNKDKKEQFWNVYEIAEDKLFSEASGNIIECYSKTFTENLFPKKHVKSWNSDKTDITIKNKIIERRPKYNQSSKESSQLTTTTNLGHELILPFEISKHKSEIKLKEEKFCNNLIPESVKNIGEEGITKFLTAKVKLLAEQLETLQKEGTKQLQKIKELQNFKDKSLEEKDRLSQQNNAAKSSLIKLEQHLSDVGAQLQTSQAENGSLKKDIDNLKKELAQKKNNINAMELKLNRTLEEMEKLKGSIIRFKQEEKELKENSRKTIEEYKNSMKQLQKQRIDLLNGFKKQIVVIENLKRQKCLIDAAKILKCAEDDFYNFLECNPANVIHRRDLRTFKKA